METPSASLQQNTDNEHLKLLSIFHYVAGGMAALFACFPIFHLSLGLFFVLAPEKFGHPQKLLSICSQNRRRGLTAEKISGLSLRILLGPLC